ncbi:hypothetical protein P0F65_11825 [Sphingomonas sp. I4]
MAGLIGIVLAALAIVDTSIGHRWVADRVATIRTDTGLRFSIGRIDGSLYSDMRLVDLRVYDLDGLLVRVPQARLDWRPWNWTRGCSTSGGSRHRWRRCIMCRIPGRPGGRGRSCPISISEIDRLRLDRLILATPVLGRQRVARIQGRADIRNGRALVAIDGLVAGTDRLRLRLNARPDRDRFDLDVAARGGADGVLARMVGARSPVSLVIDGAGRWSRWDGRARATIANRRAVALGLSARAGRYTLSGDVAPALVLRGRLQRLTAPRIVVAGQADFTDRRLNGALVLRSPALRVRARGLVDLGANRFEGLRIDAALCGRTRCSPI